MPISISFFCKKYTIGDAAAALEAGDIFIEDADFICYTNDVYLGNRESQTVEFIADTSINKRLINLKDVFCKNKTAGNTGYVVVFGNLVNIEGAA